MIHLILGGARSGKSSFAEQWCLDKARADHQDLVYVATATITDNEMAQRIEQHQQQRDKKWQTLECPLELARCLAKTKDNHLYLNDCLTLWLNNVIYHLGDEADSEAVQQYTEQLLDALKSAADIQNCSIVLVANEVGLGIVPLGKISRLFVDHAGWLNQAIAKIADQVTLVTAGIPLTLKSPE